MLLRALVGSSSTDCRSTPTLEAEADGMFLLDDILTAPIKGVLWVFKEIVQAADEEQAAEADRIKDRLRELYMQLETQQITEEAFDEEERQLLDRLDEIEQRGAAAEEEGEGDEAEDEDYDAAGYDDEDGADGGDGGSDETEAEDGEEGK